MRIVLLYVLAIVLSARLFAVAQQPPAPEPHAPPATPQPGYASPPPTYAPAPYPYSPGDPNQKIAPPRPHPPTPGDVPFGLTPAPYRPSLDLLDDTKLFEPAPATASQRAAHILQAAAHLEAAGLAEEAAELRHRAENIREELLAEKLAELERLQAEIAALSRGATPADQILLRVKVLELSRSKLRALGFKLEKLNQQSDGALTTIFKPKLDQQHPEPGLEIGLVEGGGVQRLLKALEKEDIVKVLAEPTLVTVDRRPAKYVVGSGVGVPSECGKKCFRNVGTGIDFEPTIIGDGQLRFHIRVRVAELDEALGAVAYDSTPVPGVRYSEIDTGLEMEFGKTAFLCGLLQHRQKPTDEDSETSPPEYEDVELIYLITPELIHAPPTASVPQPYGAQ